MAKKMTEAFAMTDDDEFFESSSEEEGGTEDGVHEDQGSEEEPVDSDGTKTEGGTGENSTGDDETSDREAGEEGEGEGDGEDEGAEGDQSEEEKEGTSAAGSSTEENEAGETSEGEEETEDGAGGEEEDFFADLSTETGEGEKDQAISFKKLGSALQIELETDSEEEFTQKVNEKIEASKQQIDLSKFDPQAQKLVKHLNDNGGKIGDFFVNPKISSLQNVLSQSPEEKFMMVRRSELVTEGVPQDKLDEALENELRSMSVQQIMRISDKIDTDARNIIAAEIEEIVGESQKQADLKLQNDLETVKKSRSEMKDFVAKQQDFLGLKLSDTAKTTIYNEIDSGSFDQKVDLTDKELRFAAYMIKMRGSKIKERFLKELTERSRESHNKGVDKMKSRLHNKPTDGKQTRTGHQQEASGKKNFDNWSGMDI